MLRYILTQSITTMKKSPFSKKKGELAPGILIECKSGRFIAFYEHRTDVIADGENEKDARKNLKRMMEIVREYEGKELEKETSAISKEYTTRKFTEKVDCI